MRFFKKILLFIFFFSVKTALFSQNHPNDIVGYYLVEDPFSGALSQIYIYHAGSGVYDGIAIWIQEENLKKNEGLMFLKGMTFNAKENEWQNASMIYPGTSWKFKAFMSFEKNGRLRVRGYWGVSLFGKTVYWTKEKESRNPNTKHP